MRIPAVASLLLLLSLGAVADTLVFKDGRKMEGSIVEEDDDSVTFKKGSITSKFPKSEIEKILRGGGDSPKEDGNAVVRAARLVLTGDAKLDGLRADVGKALDALAEKEKALATAAKKIDGQTRAYEAQLRKVQAAEADLAKAQARLDEAVEKVKKTDAAMADAMQKLGRVPAPVKQEHDSAEASRASIEKTTAAARTAADGEKKKLEGEIDKFQLAADKLRTPVGAVAAAREAADTAWSALADEERRRDAKPAWWPGGGAARVRVEVRVTGVTKGGFEGVTGSDSDPKAWVETVKFRLPNADFAAGTVIVVTARKSESDWIVEEVSR